MTEFVQLKMHPRDLPRELQGVQELLRRMPPEQASTIHFLKQQLARMESGYKGECKIDQKLATMPIPALHHCFSNFTTRNKFGNHYQLDTLLITNRYILYLEVKNIRGQIEFLANPDSLKRTFEGKVDFMPCPMAQTLRNQKMLVNLVRNQAVQIPVYAAIIFANTSATILSQQKNVTILYRNQLDHHMDKLNTLPEILDKTQFQKLIKTIKTSNRNFYPEALSARYGIDSNDLRRGVFCSICNSQMYVQFKFYYCHTCGITDRFALRRSILSLFTILGPHQNVRTFRLHLGINNKDVIIRTLREIPTTRKGNTKASIYTLLSR